MSSSSDAKKPSRLKSLVRNFALAGGTLVLCFALAEGILRLLGYGNVEIYQPDPKLYWRLKPNQNCFTKIDHKPVHVNSHGTRGPEFAAQKPAGTTRILMLGDSRTFGWGLTEAESYPGRIEAALSRDLAGGRRVEVINAGVNAWSYPQMAVFLREQALAWQPDIVVLGPANYWTQFSESNSPEFVRQFLRRVWLKNLLRRFALYHFVVEVQLKDFYERHRAKFIPVDPKQDTLFKEQQQADPDRVFREAIEKVCALARDGGARPVVLFLPTQTELESGTAGSDLANKQRVAASLGVPLVNPADALAPRAKELYLDADPVHFNAAGCAIVAERLAAALKPLIKP